MLTVDNVINGNSLELYIQRKIGISKAIVDIRRFETWWSKNLATVISGDDFYTLWLVVYDPAYKSMDKLIRKFKISEGYDKYNLDSVKNKTWILQVELNGENPILVLYSPSYICSRNGLFGENDYIIKKDNVGSSDFSRVGGSEWKIIGMGRVSIPRNLDYYIKQLDIIKVEKTHKFWGKSYHHVGIYLGRNQVFHFYDWRKDEKYMKARIEDIDKFFEENSTSVVTGEIVRYHPIIPFKHHKKIIEHLVKADYVGMWEGEYNLIAQNCEHLANMVAKGVNLSEQAETNTSLNVIFPARNIFLLNQEINLKNSIERTNRELSRLTLLDLINQREKYEARIEIIPQKECVIM